MNILGFFHEGMFFTSMSLFLFCSLAQNMRDTYENMNTWQIFYLIGKSK